MLDLPTIYEDLPGIIEVQAKALKQAPISEYGSRCEDLCRVYRAAAAGDLFMKYDPRGCFEMLANSGRTRSFLLNSLEKATKDASRFCKISRSNGVFDAIAAGDRDLAREIVELSPSQRIDKFEYKDDYAYARIIHALVTGEADEGLIQVLTEFEEALGDRPSTRLPVCQAIVARDEESFGLAFESLAESRQTELLELEQSLSRDEMEFLSARHLFVEGLALLELANERGVRSDGEYLGCPREARLSNPT